jgi:hypothetical protein
VALFCEAFFRRHYIVLYRETHEIFNFKGKNSCKGSMTEREMLVNVVVDVLPQFFWKIKVK